MVNRSCAEGALTREYAEILLLVGYIRKWCRCPKVGAAVVTRQNGKTRHTLTAGGRCAPVSSARPIPPPWASPRARQSREASVPLVYPSRRFMQIHPRPTAFIGSARQRCASCPYVLRPYVSRLYGMIPYPVKGIEPTITLLFAQMCKLLHKC
jgi:hypothetical protein